jgi:NAD dependent epimerase/dehydratase
MNKENLSGKKVFVTGADGFIGSHLIEHLVYLGAEVRAMVYYNSWNENGWLNDIDSKVFDNIEIFKGDIRDSERVSDGIKSCEYVFHLSSLIAIPYSYEATRSYVDTNISGALNVLESSRRSDSLTRLIHVSTSEVYGSAQTVPIAESHPLIGQSPYSASKIAADKIAESFNLSFGLPVVTARPFNTFGPRQTARAVIPTIISQVLSGSKELRLGSLSPTRDFNYVKDTANGMALLALCKEAEGQAVNIGTGKEWSIKETVQMILDITGSDAKIISDESRIRPEKSEVNRLIADNDKIKSLTPWTDQVDFMMGLQHTANWIEKNMHHFDISEYAK